MKNGFKRLLAFAILGFVVYVLLFPVIQNQMLSSLRPPVFGPVEGVGNQIYAMTRHGPYIVDGNSFQRLIEGSATGGGDVADVDDDGNLWLLCMTGKRNGLDCLWKFSPATQESRELYPPQDLELSGIEVIGNTVYIGGWKYTDTPVVLTFDMATKDWGQLPGRADAQIGSFDYFDSDPEGRLWVNAQDFYTPNDGWSAIPAAPELNSTQQDNQRVCFDDENNIWVAGIENLYGFDWISNAWTQLHYDGPLMHSVIWFQDHLWGIHYGEEGGLYQFDESKTSVTRYCKGNSRLGEDTLISIHNDSDKYIWLGGFHRMYRFDGNGDWKTYKRSF